jgi:GT2 family glycosyltransferase
MKISVIIPVLNQPDMCHAVIEQLYKTIDKDVEVIVIDNGSEFPFIEPKATVIRFGKSIGVYPVFAEGFKYASGDIVAFLHSDLVIWETNWYKRVIAEFEKDDNLGMIGFIGSDQIDWAGGRGLGTTSNFQGLRLDRWNGSGASIHGKSSREFSEASVVDGCAMIIRREAWNDIGEREDFPPMQFYDRLISTQLIEKGWKIGVLGIECDHFSRQSMGEKEYVEMAMEWCVKNKIAPVSDHEGEPVNWNTTIYQEAERRWLKEYRDEKHIIPCSVK